jgi:Tfp pilus assembly protein PilN
MKAVNLLPPDLRGAPRKPSGGSKPAVETPSGSGAYIVLGALAAAVAAMAIYVLAGNAVKDREAELATVTAEAQNATDRAAALKPYADFETLANQRLATVKTLAGARFDWNQTLHDLSRALPKDSTVTEISGDVNPMAGSANGANTLRSSLPAPALSLKGCAPSQTGVARVISRLGTINGVTRVTLASSDKDATPDAESASTGTGGQSAAYCGKGSPATFDLVVFFERDTERVSAAPGVGTAAPDAAPGTASAPAAATDAAGSTTPTTDSTQGGGTK